jgi:hypothetical protein
MKAQIVSIKRVKNNRFQAEMIDVVERPGQMNVLAKLNIGDSAFDRATPRHAWFPVTIEALKDLGASDDLIKKVEGMFEGDKITCSLVEPKLEGKRLRILVLETVVPTEYQRENFLKAAKQLEITQRVADNKRLAKHEDTGKYVGEVGYFLTEQGEYIFSNTHVTVEDQLKHQFIEGFLVPETIAVRSGAILAEPIQVEEKVDAPKF